MNKHERMAAAYLEAVAFTDFGDEDQPPADSEFSGLAKAQAYIQCRNLLWANEDLIPDDKAEQAGHDLWLTRNGQGTGFWDRPEVWGAEGADILTRCAKSMGSTDAYAGDDGLVYFS
jgi:hypothetical protein